MIILLHGVVIFTSQLIGLLDMKTFYWNLLLFINKVMGEFILDYVYSGNS